jgi:hypothetical protein
MAFEVGQIIRHNRKVMRVAAILEDGQLVIVEGDDPAIVVDPADLKDMPVTAGQVRAKLGALADQLRQQNPNHPALDTLEAVDLWLEGIPVPAVEA